MRSLIVLSLVFLIYGNPIQRVSTASAGEDDFINTLTGKWQGSGIVKVKTTAPGIAVDCKFRSIADEQSLSLDGICRAFVVITKRISAELVIANGRYSGVYRGARTGPATLGGSREGNDVALKIGWAGIVNGDQMAQMNIQRRGANQLVLEISDTDPESGQVLTTSRIELMRRSTN
ncbi:MAG: hypothetical protein ABJN26_24310 [Stappiaceae bacterium]